MTPRLVRLLLGCLAAAALLCFGAALFVHERVHGADLQRARALQRELSEQLSPAAASSGPAAATGADELQIALARPPAALAPTWETFYAASEEQAFAAAAVRGAIASSHEDRSVMPPVGTTANYAQGSVVLVWEPGPVNRVLASTLAGQQGDRSLGYRIYRSVDGAPLDWIASLPFGQTTWTDRLLPLPASRLDYEVWVVLLKRGPEGEFLVGAEPGEKVTVLSPDHFTLSLIGGQPDEAVLQVDVSLPVAAGSMRAKVAPGDELYAGDWPTGLVLRELDIHEEERLATRRRLLLATDGSLVLDPVTREPRTTETQVLVPVTRLVATFAARDGSQRVLETDLP